MTRYYVGLGSNVGDRLDHLIGACHEIDEVSEGWAVSSVYETEPVGGPEQAPYLNSVVAVDAELGPNEMLDAMQRIEQRHDRERSVRWGPRTLDLDIVAWEGPPYSAEGLEIPHPLARDRAFVLVPLAEWWPHADVGGVTAAEALREVDRDDVDLLARRWMPPQPGVVPLLWVLGQLVIFGLVAAGVVLFGELPAGPSTSVVVGAAGTILGVALAIWSARLLGPAMTASPVPTRQARLVDAGPYSRIRHPIYSGVCISMLGVAGLFASWVAGAAALALIPYFWLKAGYEERRLRMRFAGYRLYMKRVPWRLIPFVT